MKAEKVQVSVEVDHVYQVEGMPPMPTDRGSRGPGGQLMEPYRVVVKVRDNASTYVFVDGYRMLTSGRGPRVTRVFMPRIDDSTPAWVEKLAGLSEERDDRFSPLRLGLHMRFYDEDLRVDGGEKEEVDGEA